MSIFIKYGDIAVGAKEDFSQVFNDESNVSTSSQILQSGLDFPNYGNPCELYSVSLDGNVEPFPFDLSDKNIGYISDTISDNDYDLITAYGTPIVLTMIADRLYSSSGITFAFDVEKGIFPTDIIISWYRDDELLSQKNYSPDNGYYFCKNKVDFYNKVIVKFSRLNMPNNRLRIQGIEFGYLAEFTGEEIRNAQISQSVDPLSTQIVIGSGDLNIKSKRNIQYSFQARQPIKVYFNEMLISTLFAKNAKQTSKNTWNVKAEDYISLMDSVPYYGGIYVDVDAYVLFEEIFNTAKVSYLIDESLKGVKINGYIPIGTCRSAVQQLAFATQRVVDANYSNVVTIKKLSTEISQLLPLERINLGQSFEENSRVTAVSLTAHSFSKIDETIEAYKAAESGVGTDIFVEFSEPLHSLSIANGDLIAISANFARINARENCVLSGKKYKHTKTVKTKQNPLVLPTDTENVISITNATLINLDNIDSVLDRCYNYFTNSVKYRMAIYDGKHENADGIIENDIPTKTADLVQFQTEYLGTLSGRIVEQKFALVGNILKKDTVLR